MEFADNEPRVATSREIVQTSANEPENYSYTAEYSRYFLVPILFLLTALLGGVRIEAPTGNFIFIRPALNCLVFAVFLIALFVRAGLILPQGWLSEKFSPIKNIANTGVLVSLFFATTQIFNSLIPEHGLPAWIIGFCFFWMLWTNLFAALDAKRLLISITGMFTLAFVTKYLVLANFVSNSEGNWLERIWNSPAQETLTYLLDIPKYAPATGYIQFFAVGFYLAGLYFLSPNAYGSDGKK